MSDRPPSPPSPDAPGLSRTSDATGDADEPILVTTTQLAESFENWIGYRPDEQLLENVLLELDRREYVEWAAIHPAGDHVWDLSESPERIAAAAAELVADSLEQSD